MASLTETTAARKPRPAFYSILDDQHGVLTMDAAGVMWFRASDTNALTAVTPANVNFLTVNGEVGLCEVMRMQDTRRGGAATIACSRAA